MSENPKTICAECEHCLHRESSYDCMLTGGRDWVSGVWCPDSCYPVNRHGDCPDFKPKLGIIARIRAAIAR
jgi:hypothetical protein